MDIVKQFFLKKVKSSVPKKSSKTFLYKKKIQELNSQFILTRKQGVNAGKNVKFFIVVMILYIIEYNIHISYLRITII